MLRQFHFIDMNGKDQGINVRNRSSELVKLLGDVEQIRTERKKARSNRNKFGGFEGGMNVGGMSGGSSGRYGGFGSDSAGYGGYSGGVFGDGGGFGGASAGDYQESSSSSRRGNRFDEYDEYDEGDAVSARPAAPPKQKKPESAPAPPPVANMLDFDDDEPVAAPASSTATGKQSAGSGINMLDNADDDDFDDFQSATPAPSASASNQFSIQPPASTGSTNLNTQFAAPRPVSGSQGANLNGIVSFTSATPTPPASSIASPVSQTASIQQQQVPKPSGYQAKGPNYFTSVPISSQTSSHASTPSLSSPQIGSAVNKPAAASAAKPSGDAFGSLWSTASANAGIAKSNAGANKGPNLASMAKEKASAGIWGAPAAPASSTPQTQQKPAGGSAFDDLLG